MTFYGDADLLAAFRESGVTIVIETSDPIPCEFGQRDAEDNYQGQGGRIDEYSTVLMRTTDYLAANGAQDSAVTVADTATLFTGTILQARKLQDGAVTRLLLKK